MSLKAAKTRPAPSATNRWGWVFLAPGVLWIVLFFIAPIIFMVIYSFYQRVGGKTIEEFTTANYDKFFSRPPLIGSLVNSLEMTATVIAVSVLIAYPLAYILAYKIPRRWQRTALLLAIIPFWTSYLVRTYSWLLILSADGIINIALLWLGLVDEPLQLANNRGAVIVGFTHFFVMLLTLTIFANLVQINPTYRPAAADLGASPIQTFLRITLPLSIPGIAIGAFLTFVLAIGDYVTPQMLGGGRELLLPQAIVLRIVRLADFPMASALSMMLMLAITFFFIVFARRLRMDRV